MDDYKDADEHWRKQHLISIRQDIERLIRGNKFPEKLPSREMINLRLQALADKCDRAIEQGTGSLTQLSGGRCG